MPNPSHPVTVAGFNVQQDAAGRFSLNDLHRAAGGENRHRPSLWIENQQTQALVDELAKAGIPALETVHGGANPGTYAARELVYAYAMWISPRFYLQVIRAYDALVSGAAGLAGPGGSRPPTLGQMVAAQRQAQRLVEAIGASTNTAVQQLLHQLLAGTCSALGVAVPALAELQRPAPTSPAAPPRQGSLPLEGGVA